MYRNEKPGYGPPPIYGNQYSSASAPVYNDDMNTYDDSSYMAAPASQPYVRGEEG